MKIEEAKKYILLTISLGLFPMSYWIGETYLGSTWGSIIFVSSGSFLFLFSILNASKIKEIENKTIDTSKIKYINVLIVLYSVIYVVLYLVKSLKPPSSFLMCLFYIYSILTIIWVFVFEERKISNISLLLMFFAILPLVIGQLSIGEENNIKNSIETLSSSIVYYEDNLDNITNGILTRNIAGDIRYDIQLLKSDLDDAERDYLTGDLGSSGKEIEHAKEIDIELKEYFKLLDPKSAIFDMLRSRDKTIDRLYSEARNITVNSIYSNCENFELEQIIVDINLTRTKLNDSWSEYRKGDFQISYNIIKDADKDINDIEEQIHRCSIKSYNSYNSYNLISWLILTIILILISILYNYILSKRR